MAKAAEVTAIMMMRPVRSILLTELGVRFVDAAIEVEMAVPPRPTQAVYIENLAADIESQSS